MKVLYILLVNPVVTLPFHCKTLTCSHPFKSEDYASLICKKSSNTCVTYFIHENNSLNFTVFVGRNQLVSTCWKSQCLSALVICGFCCVWKSQMLIVWETVCVWKPCILIACYMWYLLCLELLHSDCFCCIWFLICLEIPNADWLSGCVLCILIGWVPFFSSRWQHFCCPCILIGWVVCRRRPPFFKWPQIIL